MLIERRLDPSWSSNLAGTKVDFTLGRQASRVVVRLMGLMAEHMAVLATEAQGRRWEMLAS
jgi:hypothetical protein